MQKEKGQWFESWFNTPYYHMLYKERDYDEAGEFMTRLTSILQLQQGDQILDLACGKGRHSVYLNRMGFDVTGVDLSTSSIASAKAYENETLHFAVHDMCTPYPKQFDAVLNLFTSFGYFENEEDNLRTINAIKEELKPNGHGVIDFLNIEYVRANLVPSEIKTVDGIKFHITREINAKHIIKTIKFTDANKTYEFVEQVRALALKDFRDYFDQAGLNLTSIFGDYQLNDFDLEKSERLILIFNS